MAGVLRSLARLTAMGVRNLHTMDVGARLAESQRMLDQLNAGTLPYTVTTVPGMMMYVPGANPAPTPGDGATPGR